MADMILELQKDGTYKVTKTDENGATMGAGALAGISNIKVAGVPIGEAVLGGGIALLLTEVISGLKIGQGEKPSKTMEGLTKWAGAWAVAQFGSKWLGKDVATAAALFMAFDGARDILPVDSAICRLANIFRKNKVDCDTGHPRPAAPAKADLWSGAHSASGEVHAEASLWSPTTRNPVLGRLAVTNA